MNSCVKSTYHFNAFIISRLAWAKQFVFSFLSKVKLEAYSSYCNPCSSLNLRSYFMCWDWVNINIGATLQLLTLKLVDRWHPKHSNSSQRHSAGAAAVLAESLHVHPAEDTVSRWPHSPLLPVPLNYWSLFSNYFFYIYSCIIFAHPFSQSQMLHQVWGLNFSFWLVAWSQKLYISVVWVLMIFNWRLSSM